MTNEPKEIIININDIEGRIATKQGLKILNLLKKELEKASKTSENAKRFKITSEDLE